MIRLLVPVLLLAAVPAAAQAPALQAAAVPNGTYVADPAHSSVLFRVNHLGLSKYTARFTRAESTVEYNAADPTRSRLTVVIDPKSLRTDFPFPEKENFDAVLAGEKWLDAGKHPEIRFVSRSIERTGDNRGRLTGDLTLHGVTRPVTLDATWNGAINHPFRKVPVFGVSARGTFKRSDFGIANLVPIVGDEVEVIVESEFGPKS